MILKLTVLSPSITRAVHSTTDSLLTLARQIISAIKGRWCGSLSRTEKLCFLIKTSRGLQEVTVMFFGIFVCFLE